MNSCFGCEIYFSLFAPGLKSYFSCFSTHVFLYKYLKLLPLFKLQCNLRKKNKNLNFEHHFLVKLSHKSGIQTAVFIYLLFPLHFYNIPQHPQSDFALIIAPLYSHYFGLMNKTRLAYPIWILIENSPARCNHRRLYCTCVNIHCVCDNIGPLLAIMTLACKRAEDKLDWLVA